jgi:hypothetical protein
MKKHEYNEDMDMKFTAGRDWHAEIWLPADAQITEIHLRVYSFGHPDQIYKLSWGLIKTTGRHLQIPIDASRSGHSKVEEAVRMAVDITYYAAR